MDINGLRQEYTLKSLHRQDLKENPLQQFDLWFQEAQMAHVLEPNAMALATTNEQGQTSNRMVLLKEYGKDGFKFFTHLTSTKALQLIQNPYTSALFWWKELERQVRIEGSVVPVGHREAATYFKTRPRLSQIAAWASRQDDPITSRQELENAFSHYEGLFKNKEIPMPIWWGGFRISPIKVEFWQGRRNRLHDRFVYSLCESEWKIERLCP
ncbi:MAG: pyridoxamine 5'-phosphate oxidase [Parachlamydiaceae bacterium]